MHANTVTWPKALSLGLPWPSVAWIWVLLSEGARETFMTLLQ